MTFANSLRRLLTAPFRSQFFCNCKASIVAAAVRTLTILGHCMGADELFESGRVIRPVGLLTFAAARSLRGGNTLRRTYEFIHCQRLIADGVERIRSDCG